LTLVAELQKLCPALNFLIGGSSGGRDRSTLLKEKSKAPWPERIVILDRHLTDEEVDQAHRIADFSLLIYRVSATSGAAVRSLCAGVPVIANDRPGFRAVVKDGLNGFMAGEIDPASEARRIHRVLKDPEALKAMKENALTSYHGITWDRVALEHYHFYRELLGSHA
jgi:glycosyltransferase involved in cell wall biosynthesis